MDSEDSQENLQKEARHRGGHAQPPRARFRPHEHVRQREIFQRVFALRRAVSDPSLVVHAIANGLNHARLGISVPRKITRRAVVRNRLKRLVREAFRLNKAALPRGVDLIVVPRQSKLSATTISSSLRVLAPDAARRAGVASKGRCRSTGFAFQPFFFGLQ